MSALFLLGLSACALAALDNINYGAFTETATYALANQLGFFAANNLNVTFLQVPNSTYGYNELLTGGYDIMTGTIDNAVNLRFNSHENLTVVGQLDGGPDLVIASIPSITNVAQLKGKPIMVDSPVSGYAYILRKILTLYGLSYENGDYAFQVVGSTNLRYAYLVDGTLPSGADVYATILCYPFTAEGETLPDGQAPTILARVSDFLQPLTSSAFTIRQDSLDNTTFSDINTRFMASMYAANLFLADKSKVECSVTAIEKQLNVTRATAKLEYEAATDPLTGETSSPGGNFTVNRQGILNVIDVRSQFGGFNSTSSGFDFADAIIPGPGKLVNYTLRDKAIKKGVGSFNADC